MHLTEFFLAMIGVAIAIVGHYLQKAVIVLNQICEELKKNHPETRPGSPAGNSS